MKRPITLPRGKIAALFIDLQEEHRHDARYLVEGSMPFLSMRPGCSGRHAPMVRRSITLPISSTSPKAAPARITP